MNELDYGFSMVYIPEQKTEDAKVWEIEE